MSFGFTSNASAAQGGHVCAGQQAALSSTLGRGAVCEERSGSSVMEKPDLARNDNGERDKFAHYVSTTRLNVARATGQPVIALCGKVWVPTQINSGHPVCPRCREIMESMQDNPSAVWPF